ncbi:MAG: hypothetical protein IJU66_01940 [Oscillospiraceae bacterium]|nr:hypothetical protein [Oscillospiraceae bacterium]
MAYRRDDPHRYDDIIDLPHHVSVTHPHMTLYDRAAQFAPFKALSGYEDDVEETARLTDERIELDESRKDFLDARLQLLEEHLSDAPVVTATYFRPDERKSGGAYLTVTGNVKKIDAVGRVLILRDGSRILMDDLYSLEGELFSALGE